MHHIPSLPAARRGFFFGSCCAPLHPWSLHPNDIPMIIPPQDYTGRAINGRVEPSNVYFILCYCEGAWRRLLRFTFECIYHSNLDLDALQSSCPYSGCTQTNMGLSRAPAWASSAIHGPAQCTSTSLEVPFSFTLYLLLWMVE